MNHLGGIDFSFLSDGSLYNAFMFGSRQARTVLALIVAGLFIPSVITKWYEHKKFKADGNVPASDMAFELFCFRLGFVGIVGGTGLQNTFVTMVRVWEGKLTQPWTETAFSLISFPFMLMIIGGFILQLTVFEKQRKSWFSLRVILLFTTLVWLAGGLLYYEAFNQ